VQWHTVDKGLIEQHIGMKDGLIRAINDNNTDLAIRLIYSAGVDIEQTNSKKERAIHRACEKGNWVVFN
jgi:hypothetical protein